MKGNVMADHAIHDMGVVFANTEIIDLCNSIKDIHRALGALGRIIEDLKAPVFFKNNALPPEFFNRGIITIAEELLEKQHRYLNRILSIYTIEKEKLYSRTSKI